jgi:hypothetical protein
MRKWTPVIPILGALGASAAVFERLPERVHPAFDLLFPIDVSQAASETMPRAAAAVLVPIVAAFVWALLATLARVRGPKAPLPEWLISEKTDAASIARFESTYQTIVFATVANLCLMHVALLGTTVGWPAWTTRASIAGVGAMLMVVGNVIPRARPNWIVGVRTKATLTNPSTWIRTHRLLGLFLMIAGALVVLASALAPHYAISVALIGLLAALIGAHAIGARGNGLKPPAVNYN